MAKKYFNLSQILKKLLFKNNMRSVDLARELNMNLPTICRIVNGSSSRPHKSSLEAIAKYFNVNIEQLTGDEPLLLDSLEDNSKIISINKYTKMIPVICWSNIGIKLNSTEQELIVLNVSNNAFATIMPDSSMEPIFQKGSTLIFDPEVTPNDRSYVLVYLEDSQTYVFRQLLVDVDNKFIKSLNPDISSFGIRHLREQDVIIARLIETRNIL